MNIKVEGRMGLDIPSKEPFWIAVRIETCSVCGGSAYKKYGTAKEGNHPAIEPIKCDCCDGYGYILDLDTAIPCDVEVSISLSKQHGD